VVQISGYEPHFVYMTHAEIWAHAQKHSQAVRNNKKDSPWFAPADSTAHQWMCKKTVLFQACKTAPKSIEDKWVKALTADDDMVPTGATVEGPPPPTRIDGLVERLEAEAQSAGQPPEAEQPEESDPVVDPDTGEILEGGTDAAVTVDQKRARAAELKLEHGLTDVKFYKRFGQGLSKMDEAELDVVIAALTKTEEAEAAS